MDKFNFIADTFNLVDLATFSMIAENLHLITSLTFLVQKLINLEKLGKNGRCTYERVVS